MYETQTVELRMDTIEQLIDLLNDPGKFNHHNPPMNRDRRMAVAGRLRQQTENKN